MRRAGRNADQAAPLRSVALLGRKLGLEFLDASFQRCQRRLCTSQHGRLDIELMAAHQIELAELRLQNSLEVALQIPTEATHGLRHRFRQSSCQVIQTVAIEKTHIHLRKPSEMPFDNAAATDICAILVRAILYPRVTH